MNHQHKAFDGQGRRKGAAGPAVGADAERETEASADSPGQVLYDSYRAMLAHHGYSSPTWRDIAIWARKWWDGLASKERPQASFAPTHDGRMAKDADDTIARLRKLNDLQRSMIERLLAGPTDKAMTAARKERDDAVRKLADANAEHQRQLKIVFAERNEAQNDARRHKRALADRDSEIASMKELRQRREAELAEAKAERDKQKRLIGKLIDDVERYRTERNDARVQRNKRIAELEAELDNLRAELGEAKAERDWNADEGIAERNAALAALKENVRLLERMTAAVPARNVA